MAATATSPSTDSSAITTPWTAWTVAFIIAVTLLRVVMVWTSPLDLIADESYYWDWGRRLAWGYYSKPPLIAWIYGATRLLGADSAALLRLPSVAFGGISMTALALLARRLGGPRVGFWATVLSTATAGSVVLNQLLTIDAPLIAAWSTGLLALWGLFGHQPNRRWWWIYAVAVALGTLAKQMMLVLPLLALLWLAVEPNRRGELRKVSVWLGLFLPAIVLIPTLAWNAHHGWIMVHHTASHLAAEREFSIMHLFSQLGGFIAGQAGVISPAVLWSFGAALSANRWPGRNMSPAERFLWCFSVPALGVITALAAIKLPEPNWPAVFWIAGGLWAALRLSEPQRGRSLRWAVGLGATLAVVALALPSLCRLSGFADSRFDLTLRLRGWQNFANQIDAARNAADLPHAERPWPLIIGNRAYASALAFYLPDQPRVYQLPIADSVSSQYQVWPDAIADGKSGSSALIIMVGYRPLPPELRACFDETIQLGPIATQPGHRQADLWLGRGLRHWPAERLK